MREQAKTNVRGVYLLPSLFTTAGLFAGFYSLIAAIQGRFELAAWVLLVAWFFDLLDGRVARLLHAETAFGAEYDSLCDMLSFGIAPAVLLYLWALTPLQKPGWLAAFLIAACAALRLARFNVQHTDKGARYFKGMPTPATAMLVATAVLFHEDNNMQPVPWLWFFIAVSIAYLMVSNVRFLAGKDVDLKRRHPFAVLIAIVVLLVLIMANPPGVLFTISMAYCLHGPMLFLWTKQQQIRRKRQRKEGD